MINSRSLLAPLLACVLLSGCATASEPAPSPSPTIETSSGSTPTPTAEAPTPTPSPEATRPALSELRLTTEGLDYLEVGAPIDERPATVAIAKFDENACPDSPSDRGHWLSTYPGGDKGSFYLAYNDDAIYRIFVTSPDILTDRGIGLGADEAALKQAYPEAIIGKRDDEFVTLFVVKGNKGNLTFEISRDETSEAFGIVTFMTAMRADEEPWAVSNTGAGATCTGGH